MWLPPIGSKMFFEEEEEMDEEGEGEDQPIIKSAMSVTSKDDSDIDVACTFRSTIVSISPGENVIFKIINPKEICTESVILQSTHTERLHFQFDVDTPDIFRIYETEGYMEPGATEVVHVTLLANCCNDVVNERVMIRVAEYDPKLLTELPCEEHVWKKLAKRKRKYIELMLKCFIRWADKSEEALAEESQPVSNENVDNGSMDNSRTHSQSQGGIENPSGLEQYEDGDLYEYVDEYVDPNNGDDPEKGDGTVEAGGMGERGASILSATDGQQAEPKVKRRRRLKKKILQVEKAVNTDGISVRKKVGDSMEVRRKREDELRLEREKKDLEWYKRRQNLKDEYLYRKIREYDYKKLAKEEGLLIPSTFDKSIREIQDDDSLDDEEGDDYDDNRPGMNKKKTETKEIPLHEPISVYRSMMSATTVLQGDPAPSGLLKYITVKPTDKLYIPDEGPDACRAYVIVENFYNRYVVAKLMTTCPHWYKVSPRLLLVGPHEYDVIDVYKDPERRVPAEGDKFLMKIAALAIDEIQIPDNINWDEEDDNQLCLIKFVSTAVPPNQPGAKAQGDAQGPIGDEPKQMSTLSVPTASTLQSHRLSTTALPPHLQVGKLETAQVQAAQTGGTEVNAEEQGKVSVEIQTDHKLRLTDDDEEPEDEPDDLMDKLWGVTLGRVLPCEEEVDKRGNKELEERHHIVTIHDSDGMLLELRELQHEIVRACHNLACLGQEREKVVEDIQHQKDEILEIRHELADSMTLTRKRKLQLDIEIHKHRQHLSLDPENADAATKLIEAKEVHMEFEKEIQRLMAEIKRSENYFRRQEKEHVRVTNAVNKVIDMKCKEIDSLREMEARVKRKIKKRYPEITNLPNVEEHPSDCNCNEIEAKVYAKGQVDQLKEQISSMFDYFVDPKEHEDSVLLMEDCVEDKDGIEMLKLYGSHEHLRDRMQKMFKIQIIIGCLVLMLGLAFAIAVLVKYNN